MAHYHAFGLWLSSTSAIPGLRPQSIAPATGVDTRIWFDDQPPDREYASTTWLNYYTSSMLEDGEPIFTMWRSADGRYFRLSYCDGIDFVIRDSGADVWTMRPARAAIEDVATYLLGPVLSIVLWLRGVLCLHAGAVVIGGKAVAFAGPAGAGKSTTTAVFAHRGHQIISDDLLPVHIRGSAFLVQPGYSRIRLWPASVEMLYGSPDALPRIAPVDGLNSDWDKRFFDVLEHGGRFEQEPVPLQAIYLLADRAEGPNVPRMEPVSTRCGMLSLMGNTYSNVLLNEHMRARQFEIIGGLVSSVPLRRLIPHRDPDRIPQLYELLLRDLSTLDAAAPSATME